VHLVAHGRPNVNAKASARIMSACNVQPPLRPAQKKIRQKQVANGRSMGSNRTAGVRFRCMHTNYQRHEGDELNQPNHRLVVLRTAGPMNHGCSIELLLLQLVDTATTVVIPLHWRAIVPGECCYLLRGRHDTRPRLFVRCCDNEEGPGTVTVPLLLILPVPCFMSYGNNIK